ncbi:hypothetical protein V493_04684 [Pseudogymnoascus sp. VKM F-4281 (FW-2241)]|nr:hypothetical protein V493_04684 [Pseudogymnoascus sp. VKM F-4281 (FW-2241)]
MEGRKATVATTIAIRLVPHLEIRGNGLGDSGRGGGEARKETGSSYIVARSPNRLDVPLHVQSGITTLPQNLKKTAAARLPPKTQPWKISALAVHRTTMARQRRQKDVSSSSDIPLAHPDKSGPDPSRQTLLDLAAQRGLLDSETQNRKAGKLPAGTVPLRDEEPIIGRFGEAVLWSSSLAMLHFTLDVLTQHQYAEVLSWPLVITQSLQAFGAVGAITWVSRVGPPAWGGEASPARVTGSGPRSGPIRTIKMTEGQGQPLKFTITHYGHPQRIHELIMKWIAESQLPLPIPVSKNHGVIGDTLFVTPPALNSAMKEDLGKYPPA